MKLFAYIFVGMFLLNGTPPRRAQGLDYKANVDFGLPLTGGASGWLGYGFLWWDKRDENFWKYGFIRPNARLFTAGIVNRGEIRLDVYPISIAGITLGHAVAHRNKSYEEHNCNVSSCKGVLQRSFIESKFYAGIDPVFFFLGLRLDALRSSDKQSSFVDEVSGLRGKNDRDTLIESSFIVGTTYKAPWNGGIEVRYLGLEGTHQSSRSVGAYVAYKPLEDWSFRAATSFGNSTAKPGWEPSIYLRATWTGVKSLEL